MCRERKLLFRSTMLIGLCLLLAGAVFAQEGSSRQKGPAAQVGPTRDEAFRNELLDYFSGIQDNSPTVFGNLAKNPEALAAIREKILNLDPDQLQAMREKFAQAPYWQMAPEILSASLTPELRKALASNKTPAAGNPAELSDFRAEMTRLNVILELSSPETLDKLGINPEILSTFGKKLEQASPHQLDALRQKLQADPNWTAFSSQLKSSLDPGAQEALQATIETKNLSQEKRAELESFRGEFVSFLAGLQLLPEEDIKGLDLEVVRRTAQTIQNMSTEQVYMLRSKVERDPTLSAIATKMHQGLTPELRKDLILLTNMGPINETATTEFRTQVGDYYSQMQKSGSAKDSFSSDAYKKLQEFNPAQVALLRQRMEQVPGWRSIPTFASVLKSVQSQPSEQLASTIRNSDPAELEGMRVNLRGALSSLGANSAGQAAAQRVEQLSSPQLAVIKHILDLAPAESRDEMTTLIASSMAGSAAAPMTVTTEASAAGGVLSLSGCSLANNLHIGFDLCYSVTKPIDILPTLSCPLAWDIPIPNIGCMITEFTSLGTSVSTILADLPGLVSGMAQIVPQVANMVANQLPSIINSLPGIISQISTLAGSVVSNFNTLTSVLNNGINGLPAAVFSTLSTIVNNALNSLGIPLNANGLIAVLRLNDPAFLISALPTLPALPCPTAGTSVASFGQVGKLETLLKYQQYQFVFEALGDIIPENEYTAAYKMPIEGVKAAVGYIGQCLESAVDRADDAAQEAFETSVADGFTSVGSQLTETTNTLSTRVNVAETNLRNQLTTTNNTLRDQLGNPGTAPSITAQIAGLGSANTQSFTNTQNLLNNTASSTQSLMSSSTAATQLLINNSFSKLSTQLTTQLGLSELPLNSLADGSMEAARPEGHPIGSVTNQLDNFKYYEIRLKIERHLLENGTGGISLLQLPQSVTETVTINNVPHVITGLLEVVREVVGRTIRSWLVAGPAADMKNAQKELALGDTYYSNRQYKAAYEQFCKAYKEAVKK